MSGLSLLAALKAFDATARWGSMTAAARALELQQPTVSAHIQRLEQEYGVELLYRRGRRLELTAFGRALLDHTRRAFSAEEDAHALLAAARSRYAGRLVVHAIGPYNVVPILKAYAQAYPQVSVAVGVGDSRTITAKICDYQGDVGLVLNHVDAEGLHSMPYRVQNLVVFAPVAHPLAQRGAISIHDLQGQRFVIREEGSTPAASSNRNWPAAASRFTPHWRWAAAKPCARPWPRAWGWAWWQRLPTCPTRGWSSCG